MKYDDEVCDIPLAVPQHKQFKHNKSSHLPCSPKTENKMKNQSHSHFHSENNMKKQEHAHFQVGINAEVTLLLLQTKAKFLLALEKKIHYGDLLLIQFYVYLEKFCPQAGLG